MFIQSSQACFAKGSFTPTIPLAPCFGYSSAPTLIELDTAHKVNSFLNYSLIINFINHYYEFYQLCC